MITSYSDAPGAAKFGARIINKIPSNYGPFGLIHLASPLDACTAVAPFPIVSDAAGPDVVALVRKSSDCSFASQVWNAQEAGASIVLVYHDDPVTRVGFKLT